MLEEVAQRLGLFEGGEEHLLVVAGQNPHVAGLLPGLRAGDHPCAVRAAVDKVAKQDDAVIQPRFGDDLGLDCGDDRLEQV